MERITGLPQNEGRHPDRNSVPSQERGINTQDSVILSGSKSSPLNTMNTILDIRAQNRVSFLEKERKLEGFEDGYLKPHMKNVDGYCGKFADALTGTEFELTADETKALKTASPVYDIGKLAISEDLWNKQGKPEPEEWEQMQRHVNVATTESLDSGKEPDTEVEQQFNGFISKKEFESNDTRKAIRHHHERWDGNGYPDKLKGDEISLPAQIIGIADMYDSLTCDRPFRSGMDHEKAKGILQENADGGQFNRKLVDVFFEKVATGDTE
jgi:HD-GYP domain-containing protein (c-di-GMP phosphodiesterase class II)